MERPSTSYGGVGLPAGVVAVVERRGLLLLAATAAAAAAAAPPAFANGVLEDGVEWWKSRKRQNRGAKLIAPLKVAQRRLEEAAAMLEQAEAAAPGAGAYSGEDITPVLQAVRASSLNCYLFEPLPGDSFETKASLFTIRQNLSDPCTFRIIVKNAVDFGPADQAVRGFALLDDLVLSYQKLDSYLDSAREGSVEAMPKARAQLAGTLKLAYDMEAFVKQALL